MVGKHNKNIKNNENTKPNKEQTEVQDQISGQELFKNKIEFNEMLIKERNEEIEQIVKDIDDLHSIFKELNQMVSEQTSPIAQIETNSCSALEKTEKSIELLKSAETYQTKFFSKTNKLILATVIGLSISSPIAIMFGMKAGIGIGAGLCTVFFI
jgi:t-SNARE complex subunit (syntaxin)